MLTLLPAVFPTFILAIVVYSRANSAAGPATCFVSLVDAYNLPQCYTYRAVCPTPRVVDCHTALARMRVIVAFTTRHV
jgi:hypothetical protein